MSLRGGSLGAMVRANQCIERTAGKRCLPVRSACGLRPPLMHNVSAHGDAVMVCRIAVLLAAILVVSCATATYSPLAICPGPVDNVQVLRLLPPEGTYTKCGSLRIEGGGLASDETTLEAAKESARRHGANAIVIVESPDPKFTWAKSYSREGSAIAIRILRP